MYSIKFVTWFIENFNGYSPDIFIERMILECALQSDVHEWVEMTWDYYIGIRNNEIVQNYNFVKHLCDTNFTEYAILCEEA